MGALARRAAVGPLAFLGGAWCPVIVFRGVAFWALGSLLAKPGFMTVLPAVEAQGGAEIPAINLARVVFTIPKDAVHTQAVSIVNVGKFHQQGPVCAAWLEELGLGSVYRDGIGGVDGRHGRSDVRQLGSGHALS